jgi:hypothetical protein
MNLACVGDSFSTTTYGLSWPDHVAAKCGATLSRVCSAGAGNAFYVEKVHDIVKTNVSQVIVQLTEPSRVVVGWQAWEETQQGHRPHCIPEPTSYTDPTHSNIYKDMGCYTMNVHDNAQWLTPMTGQDCKQFDSVWLKQVAGTRYYDYATIHAMLAIRALCDAYHKPVIFFSWFVPMQQLLLPGYEWLNSWNLVHGCAKDHVDQAGLPLTQCGHLGTESSQLLVNTSLWPQLEKLF